MVRLTKRLKLVLALIHEDEVRHSRILKALEKEMAEKETLTEADVWDMIWKDVAYHGAPGG